MTFATLASNLLMVWGVIALVLAGAGAAGAVWSGIEGGKWYKALGSK